jgi:hypothetical protein
MESRRVKAMVICKALGTTGIIFTKIALFFLFNKCVLCHPDMNFMLSAGVTFIETTNYYLF